MQDICDQIASFNSEETAYYGIERERYVDANDDYPVAMKCFIQSQNDYQALPYTLEDMTDTITANPALFPLSVYDDTTITKGADATYYRSYEIGLLDWINDGAAATTATAQYVDYVDLIGGVLDSRAVLENDALTDSGLFLYQITMLSHT